MIAGLRERSRLTDRIAMGTTLTRLSSLLRRAEPEVASKDVVALASHGLVQVGWLDVAIDELQLQYRSELRMEEILPGGDRTLVRSPFSDLISTYRERGRDWLSDHYRETSYYALFRHYRSIGHYVNWATGERGSFKLSDGEIWARMQRFFETYESIARRGYLGRGFAHRPIIVLREPYERQRFARPVVWIGYEIWSGHHRAASLAALGVEHVNVLLVRHERALA